MIKLVLANVDYEHHLTSEGNELQRGLEHAGWTLAGNGYNNISDVRRLLDEYQPEVVFVSDKRDFDPASPGSFRKDVGFQNLGALAEAKDVYKIAVVKDAGSVRDYHRAFVEEIGAQAIACYYHEDTVRALNPWIGDRRLIRTYHSVDRVVCLGSYDWVVNEPLGRRQRGIVSGALDRHVYPLRCRVWDAAPGFGLERHPHPGYHNRGNETPRFLEKIAGYKVHVATASCYGFALRKIIESVAQGCTPVTNLPAHDALPDIDRALVRISSDASMADLVKAIDEADRDWKHEERWEFAMKALDFYDYRAIGRRLDHLIEEARIEARTV